MIFKLSNFTNARYSPLNGISNPKINVFDKARKAIQNLSIDDASYTTILNKLQEDNKLKKL